MVMQQIFSSQNERHYFSEKPYVYKNESKASTKWFQVSQRRPKKTENSAEEATH